MIQKKDDKKNKNTAFKRYTNQIAATVLRGIKMASADVFNPLVSPFTLLKCLKEAGVESLTWKPETLCNYFDKKFGGWSNERCAEAIVKFHDTGDLDTQLPPLVRQKLYALRIIMTSDTAHHEWNIFEKIGCAFNNRVASFSVIEPMSSSECAKTIAIIDAIRPDKFSKEIEVYVAASCHTEGLYTVLPSKYLKIAEDMLQLMNREETGRFSDAKIVQAINNKVTELATNPQVFSDEDFLAIQAAKILAADKTAEDALKEE